MTQGINQYDENQLKTGSWEETASYRTRILKTRGIYQRGEKEGEWIILSPNGKVISTFNYHNGKKVGFSTHYYQDLNVIEAIGNHNGDIQQWEQFHTNGQRRTIGSYKNGTPIGLRQIFNKNGALIEEKLFII